MIVFPNAHTVKKNAYKQTVQGFIPGTVVVPLNQDSDVDCECLVKEGDKVEEGQLLASYETKKGYPQLVYSPIPGIIEKIFLNPSPDGKIIQSVKIRLQGSFKYVGKKRKEVDFNDYTPNQLIKEIAQKGILNTFVTTKAVPLADEMENIKNNKNRILVVRLFDDDPSRMIDSILTNLYQKNIIEGIKIAIKAIDADGVVLVTDNNIEQPEMFNPFEIPTLFLKLKSKEYPSTFKKNICSEVKKHSKNIPFTKITARDLFTDSSTILELYNSIKYDKPVITRLVHVTGNCLPASGIINTPIGTSFENLAEQCGGFLSKPGAVIVNGMITGFSSLSLSATVTKYVKSVSFITKFQCPDQRHSVCIRCGNCRNSCPAKLSPDIIYRHIIGGQSASPDYLASTKYCLDCGICNSVCPSRLPLSQRIKEYREKIDSLKNATDGDVNE